MIAVFYRPYIYTLINYAQFSSLLLSFRNRSFLLTIIHRNNNSQSFVTKYVHSIPVLHEQSLRLETKLIALELHLYLSVVCG